ncbi:MAG: ACP S-malonyltransferase [Eubacteriales bacterium]
MKAYIFPGQGAQTLQMSAEITAAFPASLSLYEKALGITGLDLLHLTEEQLAQTRYAQLAIIVHSVASLEKERAGSSDTASADITGTSSAGLPEPVGLAGFSLGEYTALYAAGIIDFAGLLNLVNERARLMQLAADKNPGAMYAILGLSDEHVEACLSKIKDVYPVNYNCPGQLVIAGTVEAAEKAAARLLALGARRAMKLAVNGAFHSPFMAEAAASLKEFARTITFAPSTAAVYSNATALPMPAVVDIPAYLETHMVSPVHFTDEIRRMRLDGYDEFIELGPGKVLTGLVKKI